MVLPQEHSTYRIGNVPDGYDPEGVYCVYLTDLTSDRNGYDPEAASLKAQRENLRRFGDALRAMPEVLCASPISTNHPGDGVHSMAMVDIDSVTTMMFTTFERESGSDDFEVLRYGLIYPADGQMEDTSSPRIWPITSSRGRILWAGHSVTQRN